MPGPGPGRRPGGHRGGPPMGGMPMGGYVSRWRMRGQKFDVPLTRFYGNHDYRGRPSYYRDVESKRYSDGSLADGGIVDSFFHLKNNLKYARLQSFKGQGPFLGAITGLRYFMTNGRQENKLRLRLLAADKALEDNQISERQARYRKMRAAGAYYKHLVDIGFYTTEEAKRFLNNFAKEIGVKIVSEPEIEEEESLGR